MSFAIESFSCANVGYFMNKTPKDITFFARVKTVKWKTVIM